MQQSFSVYILLSTRQPDGYRTTYVGQTENVGERLQQHNATVNGSKCYTHHPSYQPWALVAHLDNIPDRGQAMRLEKLVKRGWWYFTQHDAKACSAVWEQRLIPDPLIGTGLVTCPLIRKLSSLISLAKNPCWSYCSDTRSPEETKKHNTLLQLNVEPQFADCVARQWMKELPAHLNIQVMLNNVSLITQPAPACIAEALSRHLKREPKKRKIDQSDQPHVVCLYANEHRTKLMGSSAATLIRFFPQKDWKSHERKDAQRRRRSDLQLAAIVTGLPNQPTAQQMLTWVNKLFAVCPPPFSCCSVTNDDEKSGEQQECYVAKVPEGPDSVFRRSASILSLLCDPCFPGRDKCVYSVELAGWVHSQMNQTLLVSLSQSGVGVNILTSDHKVNGNDRRERSPEPRRPSSPPVRCRTPIVIDDALDAE